MTNCSTLDLVPGELQQWLRKTFLWSVWYFKGTFLSQRLLFLQPQERMKQLHRDDDTGIKICVWCTLWLSIKKYSSSLTEWNLPLLYQKGVIGNFEERHAAWNIFSRFQISSVPEQESQTELQGKEFLFHEQKFFISNVNLERICTSQYNKGTYNFLTWAWAK